MHAPRTASLAPRTDRRLPVGRERSFAIVLNARSGSRSGAEKEAACRAIARALARRGLAADVQVARTGRDLSRAARRAAREGRIVVAAGGDGTISGMAGQLVGRGALMGVLPLGTFNYFARNLGIPVEPERAAQVLATGTPRAVDVGMVNGHAFLNNASIGLYPKILDAREETYRKHGRSRWAAYLSVAKTLLREQDALSLRLRADGRELICRVPLLFVALNELQLREFRLRGLDRRRRGQLAVFLACADGRSGMASLAARAALHRLQDAAELDVLGAKHLVVQARMPRLGVALDGEVRRLSAPLDFRLLRGALAVLAPRRRKRVLH